jgi:HK97 family phage major capsid protein/HK97 family phage prohead protease
MTEETDMDDERAAVDQGAWDGNQAMVDAGAADDPAAAFAAICAGKRAGDPSQRQTWALPHHAHPGDPPNAAGVRDAESRIGQAQGLINKSAAQAHLDAHMATIHKAMGMSSGRPPRDSLVRAMPSGFELREAATGDGMPTLVGHFAVFNEWTKIDSAFEGTFMERVAPGAFRKTFAENAGKIRVLFQHGKDPHIGDKVLGMPDVLTEDATGARYEVPLFDTSYNRDLLPGLRAGAYGSSFRFRVTREDVNAKPAASARNPDRLAERTIREAEVMEFGPVTFPAYAGASAGIRSMTDEYLLDSLTADPVRLRELVAYIEPAAPSADAGASPHLEPERRETPVPFTPTPKGKPTVEYVTREEKVSRVTELKAALQRQATEYPGVMPDQAQARWDADLAEIDALERDIAAWDDRQAKLQRYAADDRKATAFDPPTIVRTRTDADIYDVDVMFSRSRTVEERDQLYRDNAMRSLETSVFPHPKSNQDAFRSHVAGLLDYRDSDDKELARRILITGSPIYKRAFNKLVVGKPLTPEETRAAALAVTGTTTTGGYMVPYVFDPTIIPIGAWTSVNPFRAACRVEQIVGGNQWTAVTATNVAAIYETEALAATEAGPTIGQPKMTAQRASAFVSVSYEAMQDRPDLPSELARLIQEGKDTLEENKFAVGTGATVYPFGMFYTGAFANLDTITNNVTAIGDTYATEAALPLRYRLNAAWFMSRATLRKWQAFETVYGELFNGLYYANVGTALGNSLVGNTGIKLLGYPVYEVPSAPHAAGDFTSNGVIHTVFGDPKTYIIVDRVGMNIEVIPNLFDGAGKPTGQRGVFAMWRNTARPLIDGHDGMVSLSVQ